VVGRFCRENILVHRNERGCLLCNSNCPFTEALLDGKSRETRIQLRHKQGYRVPVRMRIVPIRDQHGSVTGIAESFDEQRFVSDERRQHNLAVYGCLDETSGLPNHGFTQFHLRENHASFAEYHLPFGILRIQVDQLANFRAAYGREAGAAIVRVVAETMHNSLRPTDFLGRWSEDQFLAILINCTDTGVREAGERIRRVVSCAGLKWWGDELSVTVSVGQATVQAGDTTDTLLERAQGSMDRTSSQPGALAASSAAGGGAGS
jgi:diguanylate cyclase (GGDEF)-like protein